ncbi:MAG: type II toxin-antitoxin system Phd/YefM family antitoxin [Actinomycetota bacterium]
MERYVGIERARGRLGQLAEEVAAGSEPIILTKRGQTLAVIVSRDEYAQMKEAATRLVRAELQGRLAEVRKSIRQAGLEAGAVDEAIAMARGLG